jgi:hypothetical protein
VTSVVVWIFIVSQWKNHGMQFVLCLLLFPLARYEFLASAGCFVFDFASASSVLSPFGSRVTTDRRFGHRGNLISIRWFVNLRAGQNPWPFLHSSFHV